MVGMRSAAAESAASAQDAAPPPLLTAPDVARWLAVSPATVYALAASGELPCVRIGRTVRFRREAVENWLEAHERAAVDRAASGSPPSSTVASGDSWPRPPRRPGGRRMERAEPVAHDTDGAPLFLMGVESVGGSPRVVSWHVGDGRTALCGRDHRDGWKVSVRRAPTSRFCDACLTRAVSGLHIPIDRLGAGNVTMRRLIRRPGTEDSVRREGWHVGDGTRTLCGRRDGPWQLTERRPTDRTACTSCSDRYWASLKAEPGVEYIRTW